MPAVCVLSTTVLPMKEGTLQAGAWDVWLYSLHGSKVTCWVSLSWPANMAGLAFLLILFKTHPHPLAVGGNLV
jgi:hypothetical protein